MKRSQSSDTIQIFCDLGGICPGGLWLRDKSAFPPAVESRQWRATAMVAADDSERAKGLVLGEGGATSILVVVSVTRGGGVNLQMRRHADERSV